MGNTCCGGPQETPIPEQFLQPNGLYPLSERLDLRRLRKLILQKQLAPCYPGREDSRVGVEEECPICFLHYPVLNCSRCCGKRVCTECFLQVQATTPANLVPVCPFCKEIGYTAKFLGAKSEEDKEKERREEQFVLEARCREREEEVRRDQERALQRIQQQQAQGQQGQEGQPRAAPATPAAGTPVREANASSPQPLYAGDTLSGASHPAAAEAHEQAGGVQTAQQRRDTSQQASSRTPPHATNGHNRQRQQHPQQQHHAHAHAQQHGHHGHNGAHAGHGRRYRLTDYVPVEVADIAMGLEDINEMMLEQAMYDSILAASRAEAVAVAAASDADGSTHTHTTGPVLERGGGDAVAITPSSALGQLDNMSVAVTVGTSVAASASSSSHALPYTTAASITTSVGQPGGDAASIGGASSLTAGAAPSLPSSSTAAVAGSIHQGVVSPAASAAVALGEDEEEEEEEDQPLASSRVRAASPPPSPAPPAAAPPPEAVKSPLRGRHDMNRAASSGGLGSVEGTGSSGSANTAAVIAAAGPMAAAANSGSAGSAPASPKGKGTTSSGTDHRPGTSLPDAAAGPEGSADDDDDATGTPITLTALVAQASLYPSAAPGAGGDEQKGSQHSPQQHPPITLMMVLQQPSAGPGPGPALLGHHVNAPHHPAKAPAVVEHPDGSLQVLLPCASSQRRAAGPAAVAKASEARERELERLEEMAANAEYGDYDLQVDFGEGPSCSSIDGAAGDALHGQAQQQGLAARIAEVDARVREVICEGDVAYGELTARLAEQDRRLVARINEQDRLVKAALPARPIDGVDQRGGTGGGEYTRLTIHVF